MIAYGDKKGILVRGDFKPVEMYGYVDKCAVKFNQKVANGTFSSKDNWSINRATNSFTVSDNVTTISYNSTSLYDCFIMQSLQANDIILTHKFYVHYLAKVNSAASTSSIATFTTGSATYTLHSKKITTNLDDFTEVSAISSANAYTTGNLETATAGRICIGWLGSLSAYTPGDYMQIKDFFVVDLTEMYGEGNEPTDASAFYNKYANEFGEKIEAKYLLAPSGIQTPYTIKDWDDVCGVKEVSATGLNISIANTYNDIADIKVEGSHYQKVYTAKNLWANYNWTSDEPNYMYVDDDGSLICKTVAYAENKNRYYINDTGTFTISFDVRLVKPQDTKCNFNCRFVTPSGGVQQFSIFSVDVGNTEHTKHCSFTNTSITNISYFAFGGWGWTGTAYITNIQLEKNSKETSYEKFEGEIPFPSPELSQIIEPFKNPELIISGNLIDDSTNFCQNCISLGNGMYRSNINNGYYCSIFEDNKYKLELIRKHFNNGGIIGLKGDAHAERNYTIVIYGTFVGSTRSSIEKSGVNGVAFKLSDFSTITSVTNINRIEYRFNRRGVAYIDTETVYGNIGAYLSEGVGYLPYKNMLTTTLPFELYGNGTVNDICEPCVEVNGELKCRVTRYWGKIDTNKLVKLASGIYGETLFLNMEEDVHNKIGSTMLFSHLSFQNTNYGNTTHGHFSIQSGAGTSLWIKVNNCTSVEQYKNWFMQNNVYALKMLQTPIVELYDPIPIHTLPYHTNLTLINNNENLSPKTTMNARVFDA